MFRIVALIAFGFTAVAVQAAEAQPAQNPATSSAPVKAKKVCKTDPSATGSIMTRRTCRTQAEWDAVEKAHRAEMGNLRNEQDTHQMMQDTIGR